MAPDIPESVVAVEVEWPWTGSLRGAGAGEGTASPWPRAYTATWNDLPVAVDLHVLRPAWEARWRESTAAAMGGRTASPAFGPVVAEADVHWRLVMATGRGLPADDAPSRDQRWRDAALDGAALAGDRWARETLAEAPALQAVRVLAWMLAAPGVTFEERADGTFRAAPAVVVPGDAERSRAEAESPDDAIPQGRARRGAKLRLAVGAGWTLGSGEGRAVAVAPWASLARGGVRARGDLDLATGAWGVTARAAGPWTLAGVASLASVASDGGGGLVAPPLPSGRASVGVAWAVAPGWELRLERRFGPEATADLWLALRSERRTPAPARAAAPPLGARPDADARADPSDPRSNRLRWWRP